MVYDLYALKSNKTVQSRENVIVSTCKLFYPVYNKRFKPLFKLLNIIKNF